MYNYEIDEEFVYIFEGCGVLVVDDEEMEVGLGDFLGYVISGFVYMIKNLFDKDLIYLVVGIWLEMDVNMYLCIGIC